MEKTKTGVLFGASIVGAALAYYSGLIWLFPLAPSVILWWGGRKVLSEQKQFFVPVFAVQLGQVLWFISASIFARVLAPIDILEAFIVSGLAVWLLLKPGALPALTVGIVLVLSLFVNLLALGQTAVGTIIHKALTVNAVWRIAALLLLWESYRALLRSSKAREPATVA